MKSMVTSKRFGSANENRASRHTQSPIGREMICMNANAVEVIAHAEYHGVMVAFLDFILIQPYHDNEHSFLFFLIVRVFFLAPN